MTEEVTFDIGSATLTAKLRCEIDHHTARLMRTEIDKMIFIHKPEILVIDFSEVRFMDSSGIGLILGRLDKAESVGASLRLVGLSPTLMKLVRLAGIERMHNLSLTK